ncbi:long-chain-fatty-acid--CoA ligase [Actinopolyspora mortivallis]|uniref:long-chain-fatty-acid--CoA ligase n=1 Tax=Actinopolyspora mortivallis TaxID=33906 RepID=UPI000382B8F0|nr:long-chain fatty acid--CoA ligase [Actinopolyspora mortivallis]
MNETAPGGDLPPGSGAEKIRATLSSASLLAEPATRFPGRTAVVEGEHQVTYGQLWRQAREHASALRALGISAGDRVALVAPNVLAFVRVYYAVQALGAVVVPVPLLLRPEEAAHLVSDSGAKLVVGHTARLDLARGCSRLTGTPLALVGPRDDHPEPALDDRAEAVGSFVARSPEDPAVIFYTSGTTGKPKGAVLTQLNMVMNATVNAFDANDTGPGDRVLGCLPLFHVFGQTVSMNTTFRAGASLVLQPSFEPSRALELIREHGITQFHGVPTMYSRLLEAAEPGLELPTLRLCVSGGAALPVRVLERFEERFDTCVLEGYGLSETSPSATVNQPALGTRAGTVGHPLWGTEVGIADPEAEGIELLPDGETGEVVVRGHNVFAGYLNDPEATEAVLVDGWFRTGDIGRRDEDGFLSIVDRKKDLVIRNGYNVYPREVEEVLLDHPAVEQVAVIGLPDEQRGEEVCAVVVPADSVDTDQSVKDGIIDWSARRLAAHKYPRRVSFVTELPLGPSHKVLKRELRARLVARQDTTEDAQE